MAEFRDGKLKIDSKRSALEALLDISIVAMLTVLFAFNKQVEGENYIYYITFFCGNRSKFSCEYTRQSHRLREAADDMVWSVHRSLRALIGLGSL